MIELEKSPSWVKNLLYSLPSTQQFILHDNIYDFYPCYDSEYGYTTFSLSGFLARHFEQIGYDTVLSFEPTRGFSLLYGDKNLLQTYGFSFEKSDYMEVENLSAVYVLLKKLLSSKSHTCAVIFNFASTLKEFSLSREDYADFFLHLFQDSLDATPVDKSAISLYNQITFLLKDLKDFPKWYQNTKIKYIQIPKPDKEIRKTIINSIISSFENYKDISKEKREKIVKRVAYLTADMYGKELLNILLEAKKKRSKNLIEFIQTRKLNMVENPWLSLEVELLLGLKERLQEYSFICDDRVLDQIVNAIKNAYFNFSNIEMHSFLERPRSVMLFHGYHQEEQMKIAQGLSQLIFKNEDACLRVNMKEYVGAKDVTKFLDNLLSHISNFPYGIIMFHDIQKADQIFLRFVFDIIKNGKIFLGENILYFHGCIIILSYSQSCNEVDRVTKQKENSSKERKLQTFFDTNDNHELYIELKNSSIDFHLFNVAKARSYLEKILDDTIQKIKILHKVSIVLEDGVKEDILDACFNDKEYYCSVELQTIFHTIFVTPLTNLFIEISIQEESVIMIKSLQNGQFKAEFV